MVPIYRQSGRLQECDVLSVGHALVDVLAESTDEFLQAEAITKGAMNLIDVDRAASLYAHIEDSVEIAGGSAANTAAGVVACGGTAAFCGTVAADDLGEVFATSLREAGVAYRTQPLTGSYLATGTSTILVTPDGERTMNTFIGASSEISMDHLDDELLELASITYVEGYLLDEGRPVSTWRKAIDRVHNNGHRFSISLSDSFCVERHRDVFLDFLDGDVNVCFANEAEILALFECSSLDVAVGEISKRCEIAAITQGAAGSLLIAGNEVVEIPAYRNVVVDSTGAGDLYAAGVLTGLAKGWDLTRCGKAGSMAAGAIIGQMGARLMNDLCLDDV